MPSEQSEFTVATLALRPDATSVRPGARCWVIAEEKEYRARGGVWRRLLDEPEIEEDPDIGGGGSGAGVDVAITSYAELAAVETVALTPGEAGSVKLWVHATLGLKCSQLRASTEATNTADGVQRPDDYDGSTNAVAWFDV